MRTSFDLDEMTRFLSVLPSQGARELRILFPHGKVMSGLYTEPLKMAGAAAWVSSNMNPTGVYFGLHHVGQVHIPHICAGAANKLQRSPRYAVKAQHISYAGLLLVDVDPVRPSGVCSTEAEKAEASKVARTVIEYLRSIGFPEPLLIDSGNGYHVYWLASCAPGHASWRYMLGWLGRTFDTEGAKIDTSVADAARIARLPGTLNAKGPNTLERPHRMCRVISSPDALTTEPRPIYYVAKDHGYSDDYDRELAYAKRRAEGDAPELMIDEDGTAKLISEFPDHLDLRRIAHKDGRTYFYLGSCPFKGGPHRDQNAGKTAVILSDESIGFKCFSDDCSNHTFKELLALLERETGQRPSMPIYGSTDSSQLYKLYPVWGGVDDVARLERRAARKAARLSKREAALTLELKEFEQALELESEGYVTRRRMQDPEFRWEFESHEIVKSGALAGAPTDPAAWGLNLFDLLPIVQRLKMEQGWTPGLWVNGTPTACVSEILNAIRRDPSISAVINPLSTSRKAYPHHPGVWHYFDVEVIYDTSCLAPRVLADAVAVAEGSTDPAVHERLAEHLRTLGEFLGPERLWHAVRAKHAPLMRQVTMTNMDGSECLVISNVNELHNHWENVQLPFLDDPGKGSVELAELF